MCTSRRRRHATAAGRIKMSSVTIQLLHALAVVVLAVIDSASCQTTAPYITYGGDAEIVVRNNTGVELSEVGGLDGLRCHTDLNASCCDGTPNSGRWVALGQRDGSYQQRLGEGMVVLHSITSSGIGNYRCEIDTAASVASGGPREVVYVGIILGPNNIRPGVTVAVFSVSLTLRVHMTEPPVYSLICRGRHWPATSVTWKRGSEVIEGGVTTSITRTEYLNELNVTEEAVYSCEASSRTTFIPLSDVRTLNVTKPLAPVNLTVTQDGLLSVLVSWTPTGRPSHYTIYYQEEGGDLRSEIAGANDTSVVLPSQALTIGETYSVFILAETALSSDKVGPINITINHIEVDVRSTASVVGVYLGEVVRITCQATLTGTLTGPPTFSWRTPAPIPAPTVSSSAENVFVSEFIIDFFNSSYEGTYICEASAEGFPVTVENSAIFRLTTNRRLFVVPLGVQVNSVRPLQFTLTCASFGGLPTNVVWARESTVMEGGVTTLKEDFSGYRHTLNATQAGVYTCTISNDTPDSATETINAALPQPPSDLAVVQTGVDSVRVSWTPSDGAAFYTIFYGQGGLEPPTTLDVGAGTSVSIGISPESSILGIPFTFTIVARAVLPSVEAAPVNFTLGAVTVDIHSVPDRVIENDGQGYTLFCDATIYGGLSGTLMFTWTGPGDLPDQVMSSNTRSELRFQSLRLSQAGEYRCTAALVDSPFLSTSAFSVEAPVIFEEPTVSVRPSRLGPYYAGTALSLTCDVELDPAIDIPFVENIEWFIGGVMFEPPMTMDRVTITERSIEFFPVDILDNATYRCDVQLQNELNFRRGQEFDLTVEALPPLEVELIAPSNVTAGDSLTLECSVTPIPHLTVPPRVRLIGLGNLVLVSGTGFSISDAISPLVSSLAGQQFSCMAVLEIESIDVSLTAQSDVFTVSVQIPGPNVTISADPAAEGLMLGSTVTLTCAATLNPHVNTDLHLDDSSEEAVEIFWVDPLGELIRDENITVYRTEAGLLVHSSDYVVSDVGSFDEGVYECTVRVQGGPHLVGATVTEDISVSLSVPLPPEVVLTSPLVVEGGNLETLSCNANPSPELMSLVTEPPELELIRGEDLILSTTGYELTLELDPVLASQAGTYFCRSTVYVNGLIQPLVAESFTEVLTVLIPRPAFTLSSRPPGTTLIDAGSNVELICEVTIHPSYDVVESAELRWSGPRLSRALVDGHTSTQFNNGLTYTSVLRIPAVAKEDDGKYTCTLITVSGNPHVVSDPTSSPIFLNVVVPRQPRPVVAIASSSQGDVETGSSVTLSCNTTLFSPLDSVELTWEAPQMITNDDITRSNSGLRYSSILTLSDVRKEDEGEYVCTLRGIDTDGGEVTARRSISLSVESRSSGAVVQLSGLIATITGVVAILHSY